MAKKVQVTLTGNEGKRLIAKAAVRMPEIQERLEKNKILLCGGTTVSALSEELGFGPLRISGRIDASGKMPEGRIKEREVHRWTTKHLHRRYSAA